MRHSQAVAPVLGQLVRRAGTAYIEQIPPGNRKVQPQGLVLVETGARRGTRHESERPSVWLHQKGLESAVRRKPCHPLNRQVDVLAAGAVQVEPVYITRRVEPFAVNR